MKSNNVNRLLTFFLATLLLTFNAPLTVLSQQSSNILNSVALSNKSKSRTSNIITDLNQDDINASVIDYSKNQLILRISKGFEVLGTAEVVNENGSQRTSFTTSSGVFFSLIITKSAQNSKNTSRLRNRKSIDSKDNNYNVSLRTIEDSVTLSLSQFLGEAEVSPLKLEKLHKVLTEAAQNKEISQLMRATQDFTSKDNFGNFLEWEGDSAYACAKGTGACMVAAIAWVGSVSILSASCPATFGLTCAGALIAQGVLGGYAAMECADAIGTCSSGPNPYVKPAIVVTEQ